MSIRRLKDEENIKEQRWRGKKDRKEGKKICVVRWECKVIKNSNYTKFVFREEKTLNATLRMGE